MNIVINDKYKNILEEIPESKLAIAHNMITEIQFYEETLDRLRPLVEESTLIEKWENGEQVNDRVSPAMKLYNDTISKYKGLLNDLTKLVPNKETEKVEQDDFMKFMSQG